MVAIVSTLALPFGGAAAPAIAEEASVTQETNPAVAPAPDGSVVMDLQGTLWRVPAAVSPDGRSVAFSSDRSGTHGIWVLDTATSDVRPWADTPDQDSQLTWSPDGREIAWVVGKAPDDPDRQIGLLVSLTSRTIEASDGTAAPRTLTTESSGTIVAPSWGAGGVAYVLLGTTRRPSSSTAER
jgi:dipeptidyl aminopeptidase/acylaminoacyl peptidase